MQARGLLFRARELLQQHALGTAMVIVPLAMAAPVAADSLSFTYDSDSSAVTGYTNPSSGGGSFGTVNGSVSSDGMAICLTGSTMAPTGQAAFPDPGFVPGYLMPYSVLQSANGDPVIEFYWTGGLNGDATSGTQFLLSYNLAFTGIPGGSTAVAPISCWDLEGTVYDGAGNLVSYSDHGSNVALPTGTTEKFSNSGALSGDSIGAPDTWTVELFVQWNPDATSTDELSADSQINLSFIPGVSSAGTGPPGAPLPAAFGMGGLLLAAWGAIHSARHFARRTAAKR
jgi:hypothetical protein